MLPEIGPVELILILIIVTMLFGVGKLPEVFGAVGRGVKEFRQAASDTSDDHPAATSVPSATPTQSTPDVVQPV
jgi:sec-independent protein translocase protein TatA